jgi:Ras-related protein Rab-8A
MHASDNVTKVLVGNKSDINDRQVSYAEGERLAAELGIKFFETSAKTGINIE